MEPFLQGTCYMKKHFLCLDKEVKIEPMIFKESHNFWKKLYILGGKEQENMLVNESQNITDEISAPAATG